jgi:hypothetical protein
MIQGQGPPLSPTPGIDRFAGMMAGLTVLLVITMVMSLCRLTGPGERTGGSGQIAVTSKKRPVCAMENSSPKHGVPDLRRGMTLKPRRPNPNWPFRMRCSNSDAGDRDRRIPKCLEAEHHSNALLHTPMVLLDQVVQVFRRAQLRICGQRVIGFQLTHRSVRCGVAGQHDCPRAALLAFDRSTKERLGGRHIAPGAQLEVDRPGKPASAFLELRGVGLHPAHDRRMHHRWAALQGRISHFETVGKHLLAIEGEPRFV